MAETTTSHSNRENEPENIDDSKEVHYAVNTGDSFLYKMLDLQLQSPSGEIIERILTFAKKMK